MYLVSGQVRGRLNYLERLVTSSGMCVEDLYAPSGDGRVTSFIERIRVTPRDCMGPTSGNIFNKAIIWTEQPSFTSPWELSLIHI